MMWETIGHVKDLAVLVLAIVCGVKLVKMRLHSIKFGLDGITATVRDIVVSELEKSQALALAHTVKLRRDLVEIGNLPIGDRGLRSQVLLDTIDSAVDNLERHFESASGTERLAYGGALLDAYGVLLRQAREHWGSGDAYQTRWKRVIDKLSLTIAVCNSISGVEVDPSGTEATKARARVAAAERR